MYKKLLYSTLIMFFSCSTMLFASHEGPLEFEISFEKDKFTPQDALSMSMKLKNTGKKAIYVNERFFLNSEISSDGQREVYLIVESPSGEQLECKNTFETGLPRTSQFVLLEPGEDAEIDRKKNIKFFFDFAKPGKYTITGVYQNVYGDEIGVDAYKGEVISKPVIIEVTE